MNGEITQSKLKLEEAMQMFREATGATPDLLPTGTAKHASKKKDLDYSIRTTKVSTTPFSESFSQTKQVIIIINGTWIFKNGISSRILKPQDVVVKNPEDVISMETIDDGAEYCSIEFNKKCG